MRLTQRWWALLLLSVLHLLRQAFNRRKKQLSNKPQAPSEDHPAFHVKLIGFTTAETDRWSLCSRIDGNRWEGMPFSISPLESSTGYLRERPGLVCRCLPHRDAELERRCARGRVPDGRDHRSPLQHRVTGDRHRHHAKDGASKHRQGQQDNVPQVYAGGRFLRRQA